MSSSHSLSNHNPTVSLDPVSVSLCCQSKELFLILRAPGIDQAHSAHKQPPVESMTGPQRLLNSRSCSTLYLAASQLSRSNTQDNVMVVDLLLLFHWSSRSKDME